MATSDFWQKALASAAVSHDRVPDGSAVLSRRSQGKIKFWMFLDFLTVFLAAAIVTFYVRHSTPVASARAFYQGTLFYGRSMWLLLGLLVGFAAALIISSRRVHLYSPKRLNSFLHEQRLTVQVCFTSGLLLTGTLYLARAEDIPRRIVLMTLLLVTGSLCARRLIYRVMMHR